MVIALQSCGLTLRRSFGSAGVGLITRLGDRAHLGSGAPTPCRSQGTPRSRPASAATPGGPGSDADRVLPPRSPCLSFRRCGRFPGSPPLRHASQAGRCGPAAASPDRSVLSDRRDSARQRSRGSRRGCPPDFAWARPSSKCRSARCSCCWSTPGPRPLGGSSRRSSARPGGLAAGFVLARPKAESAEEAIADLCSKMADLLGRLAGGRPGLRALAGWPSAGRPGQDSRAAAGRPAGQRSPG
jgi:hypothetical protein